MALISEAFPGTYIKAADLKDRTSRVTMDRVMMEDVGGDHKPVLYFTGKDRGLVLNKTNANNIVAAFGDDTDGWHGGEIELFPTMVDFQGKSVPAVRVRVPPRAAQPKRVAPPQDQPGSYDAPLDDTLSDQVPF